MTTTTSTVSPTASAGEVRSARHHGSLAETSAVRIAGLVKTFGETHAVDGLDLTVPRGSVLGLLGPNGAGKTTTLRIVSTLLAPDAGSVQVFGHDVCTDPDDVRRRIAVAGQSASIDQDLSARQNLVLQGRLRGLPGRAARQRAEELLAAFGLAEHADRRAGAGSGGQRRRLDLAVAVVVAPDLLVLDEPTTGLDPRSRGAVWAMIRALVDEGTTVLLTTQYLEEADLVADRIAVIDHGRIVADDTPARLKLALGSSVLQVRVVDPQAREPVALLLQDVLGEPVERDADPAALRVLLRGSGRADVRASEAVAELGFARYEIEAFSLGRPSLDEVYLALTDHSDVPEVVA